MVKSKLLKVLGITAGILFSANSYSQETTKVLSGTADNSFNFDSIDTPRKIPVEVIKIEVETQSKYAKTITLQDRLCYPTGIDVEKLYPNEVKEYYKELARTYELQMKSYGNLKKDYEILEKKYKEAINKIANLKSEKQKLEKEIQKYKSEKKKKDDF